MYTDCIAVCCILPICKKNTIHKASPEMLYLIDRLHLAIREEFTEGLIGKKQPGYLSKSKRVGILPADVFPPYKPELSPIKKEELLKHEHLIGVLGGTMMEYDLFTKTIAALEKDEMEYMLHINRETDMPLIICTKYANIIIAPVMRRYD